MRVVFTKAAEQDLESIGDHIAVSNPLRAVTFVQELREKCLSLADMPKRFPPMERHRSAGIRRLVYGNYLIFYRAATETVEILHVLHGAMDYGPLLFPEN
jgi:toxin ParE1/3/4